MQTIKKLRSDVGAVQPQKLGHKAPNPSRRLIKARALLAKARHAQDAKCSHAAEGARCA
jgi:hypothetical protein